MGCPGIAPTSRWQGRCICQALSFRYREWLTGRADDNLSLEWNTFCYKPLWCYVFMYRTFLTITFSVISAWKHTHCSFTSELRFERRNQMNAISFILSCSPSEGRGDKFQNGMFLWKETANGLKHCAN
jgi:hypothetical protein